jgi:hypothetical protein
MELQPVCDQVLEHSPDLHVVGVHHWQAVPFDRAAGFVNARSQVTLHAVHDRAKVIVYTSEFAGTNKANAVVWNAGEDFDAIVDQLREQGIAFEEYPDMGMDISGGVHRSGDFKGVWFKDPDGNILHVGNM